MHIISIGLYVIFYSKIYSVTLQSYTFYETICFVDQLIVWCYIS